MRSSVDLYRMFTELPVSTSILFTIILAIWISTTSGSECGNRTCWASPSEKVTPHSSERAFFGARSSTVIISMSWSWRRVRAYRSLAFPLFPARCGPPQMVKSVPATGAGCNGGERWRVDVCSLPPGASRWEVPEARTYLLKCPCLIRNSISSFNWLHSLVSCP